MSVEAVVVIVLAGCAAGGVIGAIGVLIGLLVGRRIREMPRVRCVATEWELGFEKAGTGRRAVCSFELDLFNEGLLATGVRGVTVTLRGEGGMTAVARLRDRFSGDPVWSIDLPPRRWAHASARIFFEEEEVREAEDFRSAYLSGRFPDGGAFEVKIAERGSYFGSRKRDVSGRQDYLAGRNFRARLWRRGRNAG